MKVDLNYGSTSNANVNVIFWNDVNKDHEYLLEMYRLVAD